MIFEITVENAEKRIRKYLVRADNKYGAVDVLVKAVEVDLRIISSVRSAKKFKEDFFFEKGKLLFIPAYCPECSNKVPKNPALIQGDKAIGPSAYCKECGYYLGI